jgi:hypothetical protein
MARVADLLIHGHCSIYLLRATSRRGQRWVENRISGDRQAGAIVVEHRFIGDILRGAVADGLRVR